MVQCSVETEVCCNCTSAKLPLPIVHGPAPRSSTLEVSAEHETFKAKTLKTDPPASVSVRVTGAASIGHPVKHEAPPCKNPAQSPLQRRLTWQRGNKLTTLMSVLMMA